MSRPTRPTWVARGVVAAPRDAVWRALLAATPQLRGQDVAHLSAGHEVHRLVVSLGDPLAGTARVDVDPTACSIAMQGQWWYRGVTSVEASDEGTEVGMRVFNVAPLISRWLVALVHRHDPVGFRMQHQRLIEGLGAMLGCSSHLLPTRP